MAEEASSGQTSRKTLDDIRREIDAEFAPPGDDRRPTDDVRVDDDEATLEALRAPRQNPRWRRHLDDTRTDGDEATLEALRAPRRSSRWRGHLKVALIVTMIIEVFILGYLLGRLYGDESLGFRPAGHAAGRSGAVPPAASVGSAPTVESTGPPSAIAGEPEPRRVDAGDRVATESGRVDAPVEAQAPAQTTTAAARDVLAPAPPVSAAPASSPPSAKAAAPVKSLPAAKAPVANSPTTTARAPTGDVRAPVGVVLGGSTNWFESQSQLRAALREWLVRSGYAGPNAEAEGPEVVLGADGHTAKTRVLVRVAGQAIVREQRWRRASNGWSIVDDRQVHPPQQP